MKKIFIATTSFGVLDKTPIKILKNNSFDIVFNDRGRKLSSSEMLDCLRDCDGVIAGTEKYESDLLLNVNKLKVISRLGVGIDNIDINVAKELGIVVLKTKTTPAISVSELSLGLILNLIRKISLKNQQIKNGIWQKNMGFLLSGKTLGIIGMGVIGKSFVNILKGFNLNILAYDLFEDTKFADKNKIKYCSIDDLLSKSDIVSIHLNLSSETNKFIDEKKLSKMKPNSILINTSRGEIIDEKALFKFLKEEKILGAGLDVFNQEPYSGDLTQLDNVILTPHIGAYAKEIRTKMEIEVVNNLIKGFNEK